MLNEKDFIQKRKEFINFLKEYSPNMNTHYVNQSSQKIWPKEKKLSLLTSDELKDFNLRKQLSNEIILDVEEKYRIEDIKQKINEKKWSYELWDTGSRGVHFILKFENLSDKPLEIRNRVRKYIINEFETDLSLSKESQWMCLEWSKHFKTENVKELIEKVKSDLNYINENIFTYCTNEIKLEKQNVIQPNNDFKDFLKTDPYLKYVLENVITNGGRNDILFKNLAIGLVKSGLDKNEINKVGCSIIKNCPGKNIGEFMGWVDKCILGDLKEFNPDELIKWARLNNHTEFNTGIYKRIIDENIIDLYTIKDLWDTIWKNRITCQKTWGDLCFYNMISAILQEEDNDIRTHIVFSCAPGTGKDEGINLVSIILDKLGYITHIPAEITDRTLVGSVNQYAVEKNTKKGLQEGNEGWTEVRDYGLLAKGKCDWMAFPESETIFKPGAHNKKMQMIFRHAMNKGRRIEKGVGGIVFNLYTNIVFLMTTYSMDKDIYKLLMNGLIQRTLFYRKEMTTEEHNIIREHIITKKYNKLHNKNYDERNYINALVEKLNHMKKWYTENKHNIEYSTEIEDILKYKWKKYVQGCKTIKGEDKKIFNSFIVRSSENLNKLITLSTVWKMRTFVNKNEIEDSFNLIKKCIDSVKSLIVNQNKTTKQIDSALLIINDEKSMTVANLFKELNEIGLGFKSTRSQALLIKKLENLGYISKFKNGHDNMINLTNKGIERLTENYD